MAKQPEKPKEKPPQYEAFEELTKKLVAVPKKELDKKVKLYDDAKSRRSK